MIWRASHRFDGLALPLADRHYNRQKPGTPQFVAPGRNVVYIHGEPVTALWVTSWPYAQYTKHAWAGAWVNSLFRKEGEGCASDFILAAISATRAKWPIVPDLGMVSFVNPDEVPPTYRRGKPIYGYCYLKAGFTHVGFTGRGLWCWQMLQDRMPDAIAIEPPLFAAAKRDELGFASASPSPLGFAGGRR